MIHFNGFSDKQLDNFAEDEFLIIDNFLPDESAMKLLNELKFWRKANKFKPAKIGKSSHSIISENIRKDEIKWINPKTCLPETKEYLQLIQLISNEINRNFFLSLKDKEAMYAIYNKGAFYKPHRDRFKEQAHRLISIVFYLNYNWQEKDGGSLKIYKENNTKKGLEIEPIFNRLILFKSELLHEVMPCFKRRYSITIWLKDQLNEVSFLSI
jgi:SM-20-related protein